MGRDAKRAKQARRDRRRPRNGVPGAMLLRADVHRDVVADDGTVSVWGATVVPANVPDEPEAVVADTLPALFHRVQQLQEQLSDHIDWPVGTVWTLDGDPAAWHALAVEHGLDQHSTDRTTTISRTAPQ